MKVTVASAMTFRKEMEDAVKDLNAKIYRNFGSGLWGETVETFGDGRELKRSTDDIRSLLEELDQMEKNLVQLNLLLAEFNVKNNITGMVMWKKILIDRISYNNGMMAYCVPLRKIEDRSNGRVEVVYTPFISKKELLEANKKYQKEVREIQERILRLNMQEIDLPFDI
jgi:hypothetical protein